jgi:hypothetical protein
MRRKLLLLIIPVVIVAVLGVYLWRGIQWKSVASMELYISLETTGIQSSLAANESVNFQMGKNVQGDLRISVINNGTITLKQAKLYIDKITYGLELKTSNGLVQPPTAVFIGLIDRDDGESCGWTILSPIFSGIYEINLHAVSDKTTCWSTIVITVI